jgi:S1-C subfamily serine protease
MMKRTALIVLGIVIATASLAVAGDKHACTASTQDCLNKMVAKIQAKGWLGVETGEAENGRWAITKVYPDSPAAKAGFQEGDVFVSMNGVAMNHDNKQALKEAKANLGPGSQVSYVVSRKGGKVTLAASLDKVPDAVMAEWIGDHMVNDHAQIKLASK